MSNDCVGGNRKQPHDVVEARRQIEHYNPLTCNKNNEGTGKMHHQTYKDEEEVPCVEGEQYFEGSRKFPCFKCGR